MGSSAKDITDITEIHEALEQLLAALENVFIWMTEHSLAFNSVTLLRNMRDNLDAARKKIEKLRGGGYR